jgi:hypothetical protein
MRGKMSHGGFNPVPKSAGLYMESTGSIADILRDLICVPRFF